MRGDSCQWRLLADVEVVGKKTNTQWVGVGGIKVGALELAAVLLAHFLVGVALAWPVNGTQNSSRFGTAIDVGSPNSDP